MTNNERLWSTMFIALVASLLLVPSGASADGYCSPAGTWIGQNDAGLAFIISFAPLDNAQKQFSLLSGSANDPTSFGLFPTAVEHTAFMGTAERTGRHTFDSIALTYSRDEVQWIGTIAVSGAWTLSEDCDTATVTWHAGAFFPEDDPIYGDPFFCFPPVEGVYHRVPVVGSSCEE